MRYNLDFAVKLAKKFIKNKEVDPRKYARIRADLCGWMATCSPTLIGKFSIVHRELKRQYARLSTTLNKLDEYYIDRVDCLYWTKK